MGFGGDAFLLAPLDEGQHLLGQARRGEQSLVMHHQQPLGGRLGRVQLTSEHVGLRRGGVGLRLELLDRRIDPSPDRLCVGLGLCRRSAQARDLARGLEIAAGLHDPGDDRVGGGGLDARVPGQVAHPLEGFFGPGRVDERGAGLLLLVLRDLGEGCHEAFLSMRGTETTPRRYSTRAASTMCSSWSRTSRSARV